MDRDTYSLLHQAIEYGYADIVKILIESGADTKISDAFGRAPLHHAADKNCVECVQALLSSGVNPDEKKTKGDLR